MAVDLKSLIDINLLGYFKSKLDLIFASKVDKVEGKGLSTNDYTADEKTKLAGISAGAQVNTVEGIQVVGNTVSPANKIVNIPAATQSAPGVMTATDKQKLDGIAAGAQANVIETIKKNGTALSVTNKAVDISVPTNVTDLSDASDYATKEYVTQNGGKIDKIKVNGVDQTIINKVVDISVPTKTSNLANDSNFVNYDDLESAVIQRVVYVDIEERNDGYKYLVINFANSHNTNITGGSFEFWANNVIAGKNFWYICHSESDLYQGLAFNVVGAWGDSSNPSNSFFTFAAIDNDNTYIYSSTVRIESLTQISGRLYEHELSDNDYTNADKSKLDGIAAGAQVNVVTNASSTGSGASETMTVNKGATAYTTYTKNALDSALGAKANASNVYTKSEVYTKTEVDQKMVGAMNYKGTKATTSALPSSGNTQGDVWHITADGSEWAWNGSAWEELGTALDLSGYVEDSDLGLATNDDIDALFT